MNQNSIFDQEEVTIVVTDSGLGGISITADVAERLKRSGIFRSARIIFFNSSFDNKSGYNVISDHQEKIRIFNNALNSMASRYQPDLILIGCNTLSVLFPETPFSTVTTIPVTGIVETGVEQILLNWQKTNNADIFLFGTQTTISGGSHKKILIANGIPSNKIYGIACGNLADLIEEAPGSSETGKRISRKVSEGLAMRGIHAQPVIAALVCTHYGYVADRFEKELNNQGANVIAVINPNPRMTDFLIRPEYFQRFPGTEITVEVICKVQIFPSIMESITKLIQPNSPITVQAIRNYHRDVDLF